MGEFIIIVLGLNKWRLKKTSRIVLIINILFHGHYSLLKGRSLTLPLCAPQSFSSRLSTALWSSRSRSRAAEEVDPSHVRTVGSPAKGRRCVSRTNTFTSSASPVKVCHAKLSPLTPTVSPDDSPGLGIDWVWEAETPKNPNIQI